MQRNSSALDNGGIVPLNLVGAGARRPPPSPAALMAHRRWVGALCLSIALLVMAFQTVDNSVMSGADRSNLDADVMRSWKGAWSKPYEPLIGREGGMYSNSGSRSDYDANINDHGSEPDTASPSIKHPHVACFANSEDCPSLVKRHIEVDAEWISSIPRRNSIPPPGGKSSGRASSSEDGSDVRAAETDECKLSDPSYQAAPAAPSTCNDVHALPFRFGPTPGYPMAGINPVYPSAHRTEYLTSGGFRAVWTVHQLHRPDEPAVILKTNRMGRGWSSRYLDQNRRDALVSGRAGSPRSGVLPVRQYCAFSSVVPLSTAGPLDEYVGGRRARGDLMSAGEQYGLAAQAARGVHEMQLYSGGAATHVHVDVKPPQFLLFDRGAEEKEGSLPILQINDFNRGRFLTRSVETNETCPFRMCNVHHKGSTYRSPEEYMDCADQSDTVDVYSLGGVFFYLLSDGKKPWYNVRPYSAAVEQILKGKQPKLPKVEEYGSHRDDKIVAFVRERSEHPAFLALKEVMKKCWAFEPKDRPSSLQVVEMLETKWRDIDL